MTEQGAVRVSDLERERVAERLAAAHGEGRLTLAEYDERVRTAHGAVVRDDLAPLLADLPAVPGPPGDAGSRPAPPRRREPFGVPFGVPPGMPSAACGGGRGAVAVWAVVSVVNVVIWLAVSVGTAALVYPWWIWVAGPWGLALALGGLGRAAVRPRV
ncbi:DUF1707 SHOCT-like domain-containing protein [Actinomycetospora termitidis]|uniref:DUF1707 domain-containing protein n=1 Tax=Actinomycetospora termitidis TaxID=3053470 RepID=A0ABT7M4T6_9PSEU|nr:DUF1707 domain-containing protein [Actinomycetospora sp. Odt1-22]MDL5155456.1 DUF1707 domain-containing protein [Actinomycetospora sp. Odt1-22]